MIEIIKVQAQIENEISLLQSRIKHAERRKADPLFNSEYWQGVQDTSEHMITRLQLAFGID